VAADILPFPSPPAPPPSKKEHRVTFFTLSGASGRPLVCAVYELASGGLELRLFYVDTSDDSSLMRSQLFHGVYADKQVAQTAAVWRVMLIDQGFTELE
jgi:hypothetical protein